MSAEEQVQFDLPGIVAGSGQTSSAVFSPCRKWRYELWRRWEEGPYCMFLCLNPSTADETVDDPTVRRCIRYSQAWGYSAFVMTNIFAWRDTDPADMKKAADPIGPENDVTLKRLAAAAGVVVAGWGNHGDHLGRSDQVRDMIPNLHYLKLTGKGQPNHPLYLKKDLIPIPWKKNT